MAVDSKSDKEMELVVAKKNYHKETQQCDEWLYSEKYSIDNRGHTSLMISGLLTSSGIRRFYRLIEHAISHLNVIQY